MPGTASKRKKDSRISKTDRDIKRAMLLLIAREPFAQITVGQIMEEAPVTKVTFYRHFASKEAVLDAIREDLVAELAAELSLVQAGDLEAGVLVFYRMMERQDAASRKLFHAAEYEDFRRGLRKEYFSLGFFQELCPERAFVGLLPAYISDAAYGIYRSWQKRPEEEKGTIEDLAAVAGRILTGGLFSLK